MSYILEALKKSQAERQLGELPSIHAPQVQLHDAAASGASRRAPVWLALGGVAVAVAAAMLLWQPWQAAATAPAAVAVVPTVLAQAVPAPMPVAAPPATPAPAPVPVAQVTPVPPAATAAPVHHARPVAEPKQESPGQAAPSVPAPAPAVPAPAAEETVPGMRDLPEPIQRQIPAVAIGGYIYSKNPADRLLLIDKVLRHEGEELAPGLVLEKLQPKAAIFSFKGYRYRVPY
ncbi:MULTISPECIES: general secretion pathway protein GspB [Janthinobacterium]|uniref:general secretion pathway protein GspB n=1 Tax=Janthinobacterium TaxID=29580 RepID=UPI001C5AE846|nr:MULTISPECIES: general secretion pathway protein GspB [Janthinobacterium]MBW3510994.1 general secretion pathway protein GspB [Janthinobacterium sp. NKUCC06_STL]MCA1863008.1 general secretion pathway protein GspB [Janthinobacterium lividum]